MTWRERAVRPRTPCERLARTGRAPGGPPVRTSSALVGLEQPDRGALCPQHAARSLADLGQHLGQFERRGQLARDLEDLQQRFGAQAVATGWMSVAIESPSPAIFPFAAVCPHLRGLARTAFGDALNSRRQTGKLDAWRTAA